MSGLPWWLNPWREVRRYRVAADFAGQQYRDMMVSLSERNTQLAALQRDNASLRSQLAAAVTDARVSGSALATDVPEIVITGTARGSRGKRIHVSREIEVTAFAMTEPDNPPPRFKIGAVMGHLLVIDKPTYGECLAHLATIWANQDRDQPWSRPDADPVADIRKIGDGEPFPPGDLSRPVQGPLQLPTGDT